jgi:nucleotide-binding universal stress UspA family protein
VHCFVKGGTVNVKRILFPTDFSECSQTALACASALASEWKAQLFIVHVDDLPFAYIEGLGSGYAGHGYVPEPENARDEVRDQLGRVLPTAANVICERRYLRGNPAHEILKFAERENVDLIVMGTHGHTAALRLLMGSVAESVMRRASCPVLTVRQPSAASTAEPSHTCEFSVTNQIPSGEVVQPQSL